MNNPFPCVVSDCDSVGDPAFEDYIGRRFPELGNATAKWEAEAAAAVAGGCDFDCGSTYTTFLPGAVRAGLVSEAQVDASVARLLSGLFALGMFDPHAGLDEGLRSLNLSNLLYIENPYSYKK
jgi:beta-glucosidase-like glycosyl hydrolase